MESQPQTIHVAVYNDVASAAKAIKALGDAGVPQDDVSVLCSDHHRERLFGDFVHEKPAGSHASQAVGVAGVAALGLGGAVALTSVLTTAGTALFAIGAFAGVAAIGTFTSLMLTRGVEHELADYYDQAVENGNILVAVESDDETVLKQADQVFQETGEKPVEIPYEA